MHSGVVASQSNFTKVLPAQHKQIVRGACVLPLLAMFLMMIMAYQLGLTQWSLQQVM
jgi:hypothetical protein